MWLEGQSCDFTGNILYVEADVFTQVTAKVYVIQIFTKID